MAGVAVALGGCTSYEIDMPVTTEQTCEYLHISERKLRSMKEQGKIGFSHLGRMSQFKGEEVLNLLSVGTKGA